MTASSPPSNQIAFLLGKPLGRETVLAEVVERLHRLAPTIILHHAANSGPIPEVLFRSGLVVQRGLNRTQLDAAERLEQAGVRCCNRIAPTRASNNRAGVLANLAAAGICAPETRVVETWSEVLETSRRQAIVVKEADERTGRGQGVLIAADSVLPDEPPFRGPYVVQEYIPNNGTIQKLYVAGGRCEGLSRTPCRNGERSTRASRSMSTPRSKRSRGK